MKKLLGLPKRLVQFVKSVFIELKLVEFPTRSFTLKNTHLVIIISLLIALTLLLVDGAFNFARNYLTLNL